MPEQKRAARNKRRYVPVELVEKILWKLPVKSVVRFSSVSKSWYSMIREPKFVKEYGYGSREMVVLRTYDDDKALMCPVSSMSSDNPADNARPFFRPFTAAAEPYFNGSCGQLWCVEIGNSVCLYNPSLRTYRKLPDPPTPPQISECIYGLGYDDDYKILKACRHLGGETELYSLRYDCWRKISDTLGKVRLCMSLTSASLSNIDFSSSEGLFVRGALHWLVHLDWFDQNNKYHMDNAILSFDLSTEKYGKVALPEAVRKITFTSECRFRKGATVLRGKLCVYINRFRHTRFVVWVMEDFGWTKEMNINYANLHPFGNDSCLKPLFFYDSGGKNLLKAVTNSSDVRKMFVYKDRSTLVEKNFGSNGCGILDCFTYVESLAGI